MRHEGGKGTEERVLRRKGNCWGKGTLNLIKGVTEQYMSCESSFEVV